MASKKAAVERAVVVFTDKRGVFFGYTSESNDTLITRANGTIARARMCTYWSAATKGALGLASIGPQVGSRVGPQVPDLTANGITAVVTCSSEAAQVWERAPWT